MRGSTSVLRPVTADPGAGARRDLVLAAASVVALSRFADGVWPWMVAVLLVAALAVGVLQVLGDVSVGGDPAGVPIESLLTPAAVGFAAVGTLRLVPIGLGLVPAVLAVAFVLDRSIRTEARLLGGYHVPTDAQRTRVLVEVVVVGFLAFLGAAALVPGGLPEPGGPAAQPPLSELDLLILAGADALVAGVLGYRASALRMTTLRDALWSAATYASAVAIAAAALRAMDIPRLVGPALLTLVFFLWHAFHAAPPGRRRDPRWVWQTVVLVALGVAVVVWNLSVA